MPDKDNHVRVYSSTFTGAALVLLSLAIVLGDIECQNATEPSPPDTTSHAFTWQLEAFGDGSGSVFRQVTIIDDTLAYAVGEVHVKDSTGQWDPLPLNVAVWNGRTFKLDRVDVKYRGTQFTPPLYSVFAFSPTDIWLSAGVPIHGDGHNWTLYQLFDMGILSSTDGSIEKIWGESPSNIYFVGKKGTIVHYDGNSWVKLTSGTSLDIQDIWGARDPTSGQLQVLAVAANDIEKKVLQIQGSVVSSVPDSGLSASLHGIWFVPNRMYLVVGAGIGQKAQLDGSPWTVSRQGTVTTYMSGGVRGAWLNDIFVVGGYMEVVHYNGSTWHNYSGQMQPSDGALGGISIGHNLVMSVGVQGPSAIVLIGRR